jgi:hypothetical protein
MAEVYRISMIARSAQEAAEEMSNESRELDWSFEVDLAGERYSRRGSRRGRSEREGNCLQLAIPSSRALNQ